jgi:hypothetical protein
MHEPGWLVTPCQPKPEALYRITVVEVEVFIIAASPTLHVSGASAGCGKSHGALDR